MNRFLSFLPALLVAGSVVAQAQTAPATTATHSSSTKMTTTKTSPAPTTRTTTTTSTKMKADGTPSMRYKTNKTTTRTVKTKL